MERAHYIHYREHLVFCLTSIPFPLKESKWKKLLISDCDAPKTSKCNSVMNFTWQWWSFSDSKNSFKPSRMGYGLRYKWESLRQYYTILCDFALVWRVLMIDDAKMIDSVAFNIPIPEQYCTWVTYINQRSHPRASVIEEWDKFGTISPRKTVMLAAVYVPFASFLVANICRSM